MFDVYLYDVRLGTLTPRGRGLRFAYTKEALADARLPALSISLPKQEEPFPDSQAGPFFRNLLPEQAYRRLVATAVGTAPENSAALLGAIGGECPGAVSIWPSDAGPLPKPQYEPLDIDKLRTLFSPTDSQPLANAISRGRLSLAGAQEKIALLRDAGGKWHLPLKGAVSSHILKQGTTEVHSILENELLCMELARRCHLLVPATGLPAPGVRVFCCERFDRPPSRRSEPPRQKLHQEDFCQILGVDPERKYEADGGPGLKACASVIRQSSSLPADDLVRLIRWVGFNYLIGNEDAHAKNLALLYLPDGLSLTPHYDLVSTKVYDTLERRLAMKVGRAWDIRNVQLSDWQRLAAIVGLPWEEVRPLLLKLSDRVRGQLNEAGESVRDLCGPSPFYDEIAALIRGQCDRLESTLGTLARRP
jgi:serine/threonine-protein kinase HipA